MFFFQVLGLVLLAATRKPTTWFLDGNNLIHQKGLPRDKDILAEKIQAIEAKMGAEAICVVFDGRPGDVKQDTLHGRFRRVDLAEGGVADDFILEEIKELAEKSKLNRVQVVTADRRLRSAVSRFSPTVKGVVNPVTFWKKHRVRMSGEKSKAKEM